MRICGRLLLSTYPREGCVKVQSRINYKPACGIVEARNALQDLTEEMKRFNAALARWERTQKAYRRRGEWGKRGGR